MTTLDIVTGSLMLVLSVAFLVNGVVRIRRGASFFGKGGSSTFVLLGFALFAMGSMVFLIGIFRAAR